MRHAPKRCGFTLVEMAVVLTIIALVIGGILGGQSMIRGAQVRSAVTDFERFQTSTKTFKDRFKAIPGDMINAASIWGSLGGTGNDATCQATPSVVGSTATCSGDGSGDLINSITAASYEWNRYWQHLSNAGLIEGFYVGGNNAQTPGVAIPRSKLANAYIFVRTGLAYGTTGGSTVYAGTSTWFAGDYGKSMYYLRTPTLTAGNYALNPIEAMGIDQKMDDGYPGTGTIIANKGDGSTTYCTSAAGTPVSGEAGATYKVSNTRKDCSLFLVRAF